MPGQSSIDIENPKQTIETCFKMTHYVVPAFQREYVWEENEIETLLSDIESAFEHDNNKEYFLGTTVVYKSGDKWQLIDGQQRLTTFFLILCALAKKYSSMGASATSFEQLIYTSKTDLSGETINAYSLELQYENTTQCLANVWEDKIPADYKGLSESSKRIYDAYGIITKKLNADYNVFSEYKKFAGYFINKVVFIQIGATNMAEALKIFETINQRGVILNPMDLLKNMLFMQVEESQFKRLNSKWKSMIEKLEKMKEKPLRFLRYYITATYDISDVKPDYQGIINDDEIYNWLLRNNDKCHYREAALQFTDDMIDGLNRFDSYLNPGSEIKGRDYLIDIKSIMGRSYRLHLVPLLASKGMDDDLRARLFKVFDLIIYYSVVNNIKSNVIERLFSSWCPSIRGISDQEGLDAFIAEKVSPTITSWNLSYKQNFMSLSMAGVQKYKIKAILARLSKYVDAYRASSPDTADIAEYLKSHNQIEHIMPVACDDIERYGIYDREEYDIYKERLGNLSLLEKTINESIQNDEYELKVEDYKSSNFYHISSIGGLTYVGGNTAINRMNRELIAWDVWNKSSIEERQEMLYRLSKTIWDVAKL